MARILKILIIEEKAEIREVFRTGLEGIGQARLLFAPSLKVGVVALKKTPFDILMLRGVVARQNNFALLRALRADASFANLAIIVVQPECSSDESQQALAAGATSCMASSLDPRNVRAAVINALKAEGQPDPKLKAMEAGGKLPDPIDHEEDARRLFYAGIELLSKRLFAKAAQMFLAALKRKPVFPEVFSALADCFAGLGDPVKAFAFRHKAVSVLAMEGRVAEAGKAMRKLGDAPAGAEISGNPMQLAAQELREQGRVEEALQVLEAAVAQGGGGDALRRELAGLYVSQGKEKRALRILTEGGMGAAELSELRRDTQASSGGAIAGAMGGGLADDLAESLFRGADKEKHSGPGVLQEQPAEDWKEKRRHPRIPLADFTVQVGKVRDSLTVVDISMGGICFKSDPDVFEAGQVFRFHLVDSIDVRLKKVQAVVRFVGKDRVGCQFLELSDKQTALLEELIQQEKDKLIDAGGTQDQVEDLSGIERDASGKIVIKVDW